MKSFIVTLSWCLAAIFTHAQKPPDSQKALEKANSRKMKVVDSSGWHNTGFFIFNLNQAALSDWSSGGENFLIGINGILNYALHHRKGKYSKDTYIDIELGAVEASSFNKFRKTTDRCDITVELDHSTRAKNIYYGLLLNFNTQFLPGRVYTTDEHYKISNFLSPGKILLAPGLDIKKQTQESYFSIFISPATVRLVTKIDEDFYHQKRYGVDSAQRINTEFGAYISSHYNLKISGTARYIGRLDLYSNYLRNPHYVDVLMSNLLSVNISNVFAANVLVDIVYDHDIRDRIQLQEIFGLGLKLKL
jgi:hypothetical protein